MLIRIRSIYEGVRLSLYAIWSNKLRSALTTSGIVIGIVMVTTMVTVIDGINRSFESSMEMLGQDVVFVQKWPWGFGGEYRWWDYVNRREMDVTYASEISARSTWASAVSAEASRRGSVTYRDETAEEVQIDGVTASYIRTSAIEISDGRFFTEEEDHAARNVVILGHDVADALFNWRDPVGQRVRIGGRRFEVIGVLERQGNFLGMQSFDNMAIIPINTFRYIYGLHRGISIRVQFDNDQALREGQYEIEGIMRQIRRLDPAEDNDFAINRLDMFEQQYRAMTGAIYGVGIFLTALSLFVGGIGVMNIMYVSVKERTREIGIRKAVGARYREVLQQFLVESVVICFIGGILGIMLSGVAVYAINQYFVAHLGINTILLAFVITTITGLVFGFLPAHKAAKSDPIESLRYS
ncbi:ABC transporter permease [Natronogracilivirga saccharolytica]|uniref:ABC transporter permease n=1 Tax=Natronogracilivirga saccharolytica TaxID=2812953 RepID=A0A8J7RKA3_9BACT|nr:ABC transporter permease [Natronogracilivirga saccharolytica]MBP3191224.1 ABC transporter permease [Natronogracilivirga saccharolytica]